MVKAKDKEKSLATTATAASPSKITADDVRRYFCENATQKEIGLFLQIAKMNNLNPFKREVYLVKYGNNAASILTGYEVYLKRAQASGNYGGFKVWVTGEKPEMKACIEVYRKDWDKPLYHEVEYVEYVQKTRDKSGNYVPNRMWASKPKTMLKKVVISQAMRFAFPEEVGGLPYTSDEIHTVEADAQVVDEGQPAAPAQANGNGGSTPTIKRPNDPATEKQKNMLKVLVEKKRISWERVKARMVALFGKELGKNITKGEISQLIDWAQKFQDKDATQQAARETIQTPPDIEAAPAETEADDSFFPPEETQGV